MRKGEREVLFEAVRDEHGDLSLEITGTGIAMDMPTAFWKDTVKRMEKRTETDEVFDQDDLARRDEVVGILKQAVSNQEE